MVDKYSVNVRWYEKFTFTIVTHTEHFFYILGKTIAQSPGRVIALCWMFVFLSSFGLLRFYQEKNPMHLWVPPQSQFVKDSEYLMSTFDNVFRIEGMQIVGDDILTPEVLLEVFYIEQKIRYSMTPSGIKWTDVCFKIPEIAHGMSTFFSSSGKNGTDEDPSLEMNPDIYCSLIESMDRGCYIKTILDLWDNNERKIKKMTKDDIINKINKYEFDPLMGKLKNYQDLLGGITRNKTGHIISAKSLNTLWMTHLNFTAVDMDDFGNYAGTSDWASAECMEWEDEFLKIMVDIEKNVKNFQLYYFSGRSFGDISGETMFQDIDILCVGVFIMVLYVQFVISKFNCVEARMILGGLGLLAIGMAFISACGICCLLGIFYGPVHTSLPFLLMGLGVDDMFVIVACWGELTSAQKKATLPERVGYMMRHAGVSISLTTATDVLAFLVGASTVLPCLQSFCLYAAMGVLMTYFFVITFFVACFTLDQKRIENNYGGVLIWKKYENYKPNNCSHTSFASKLFNYVYQKVILTWPGKLFVILITLVSVGFSIESILKLEQRFDPKWFIPEHTYLGQYIIQKSKYFPSNGFEAGTFIGAVNYTYEYPIIKEMSIKLENSSDIINSFSSWIGPFERYVKSNFKKDMYEQSLTEEEFNTYLSKFLFSPGGAPYQSNFIFNKKLECGKPIPKIIMSSIDYRFNLFSGPEEHIPAMRRITAISKDLNLTTGDKFSTTFSKVYATWITDEIIDVEMIRNIELALIAVMTCTALLIANVQICFWVFVCIVLSMINVCGFMQRWGLTIDLVTCIGLQLAIGLCVDYATHIGHTFLTLSEGSLNDRALKTVTTIGSAVMCGGLSTMIGVSMLGFSDAYNFQTFFKIFVLVVVFGLYHGVVLLPVILSWVGPKPYFTHKPVQQMDMTEM